MRRMAFLAIVLGSAATATAVGAQPLVLAVPPQPASAAMLAAAAFAPKPVGVAAAGFTEQDLFVRGSAPLRMRSGEVRLTPDAESGPVDSLRVTVAGVLRTPAGLPLNRARPEYDAASYEVSVIRNWPSALSYDNGAVGVDFSPHAGVGLSSLGGSAEAGAMLRVGKSRDERAAEKLKEMGISDGSAFGSQGRWYVYAAASGRAVGLNMLHGDAGWNRAGWTTDPTSALIGDAQLGVGWRKGDLQSSLGYVHREVKGQHMIWGQQTRDDSLLAFSLTFRPQH
jgi:hypothetical protein